MARSKTEIDHTVSQKDTCTRRDFLKRKRIAIPRIVKKRLVRNRSPLRRYHHPMEIKQPRPVATELTPASFHPLVRASCTSSIKVAAPARHRHPPTFLLSINRSRELLRGQREYLDLGDLVPANREADLSLHNHKSDHTHREEITHFLEWTRA
ncbi:hypothetical protein RvY_16756 [Ramazzottius varieornatus]|uniref:Uncharacterized protein n=1 Tax=Ramazzottius varieornatus TaxID=947166 RepID=A0A1D1VZN2_RAMVA|nr:hypothetical protein RvY_16756 [Ramazzottius varieornatus]